MPTPYVVLCRSVVAYANLVSPRLALRKSFYQDWHYGQECSCTPVGYAYSVRCFMSI
ncbi:MAG: hypothetical protein ACOX2O_04245 [Bdellovibrionota bacterium]